MSAIKLQVGDIDVRVTAQPLTQEAFEQFGDVINNPRPDVLPTSYAQHASSLPANAFTANQGYAIQYRNVSRVKNLYAQAPSGRSQPATSMFVCSSRPIHTSPGSKHPEFTVKYLERHPYTTQTFTPVASRGSAYLVIVAPSLPPSEQDKDLPAPSGQGLPGRGLPDLKNIKAFIATRAQAVTYGAGTWHAPMVVLGAPETTLDFVVSQSMSGEAIEDCQLLEFESKGRPEPNIRVQLPTAPQIKEKL